MLAEGRARRNPQMQGTALLSIGEIHLRLGNLDMARPLFEESRTHFELLKDLPNVGRVWQAAALTELMSARFPAAEQAYGKSSAACAAAKDPECVARGVVGLAFAQSSQDRFAEAIATYRKAIEGFTALRRHEDAARAEVGLSGALLGGKDAPGALAAAGRARQQGLAIGDDDVVWRACVAEARALRSSGEAVKAISAAWAGVAAVQRLVYHSQDQPGEFVAADTVTAYGMLAILLAEAGDAAGAFAAVERRRTHALRVALAPNERDITRGMTADERGEERTSAAELRSLRVRLDHERTLPKPDAARMAKLADAIDAATAARRAQQQRLFERLPDLRTWRGFAVPVAPDDVLKALGQDGTIAVEFVIDDDALLAVVAEPGGETAGFLAKVTAISRQTLAERIARAVRSGGASQRRGVAPRGGRDRRRDSGGRVRAPGGGAARHCRPRRCAVARAVRGAAGQGRRTGRWHHGDVCGVDHFARAASGGQPRSRHRAARRGGIARSPGGHA